MKLFIFLLHLHVFLSFPLPAISTISIPITVTATEEEIENITSNKPTLPTPDDITEDQESSIENPSLMQSDETSILLNNVVSFEDVTNDRLSLKEEANEEVGNNQFSEFDISAAGDIPSDYTTDNSYENTDTSDTITKPTANPEQDFIRDSSSNTTQELDNIINESSLSFFQVICQKVVQVSTKISNTAGFLLLLLMLVFILINVYHRIKKNSK